MALACCDLAAATVAVPTVHHRAVAELLLAEGTVPTPDQVKALVLPKRRESPVDMPVLRVDLSSYDALLRTVEVAS